MAVKAKRLCVVVGVFAAFSQRRDVIALRGQCHAAIALAFDTQRSSRKQLSTHALQLAACDAFGGIWLLCPSCLGMLSTSP